MVMLRRFAFALIIAAGLTGGASTASADVLRVALNIHGNDADYQASAAVLPRAVALLRAAAGHKASYATVDPAARKTGTVAIFGSRAELDAVLATPAWQAIVGELRGVTGREVNILMVQ